MQGPKEKTPLRVPSPQMWNDEPVSVKKRSMMNEKSIADYLGFELTPGSGNQDWPSKKGDGSNGPFRFEMKETTSSRISVNESVIGKICQEARATSQTPVLILSAYGLPDPYPKRWVAMPIEAFRALVQEGTI